MCKADELDKRMLVMNLMSYCPVCGDNPPECVFHGKRNYTKHIREGWWQKADLAEIEVVLEAHSKCGRWIQYQNQILS